MERFAVINFGAAHRVFCFAGFLVSCVRGPRSPVDAWEAEVECCSLWSVHGESRRKTRDRRVMVQVVTRELLVFSSSKWLLWWSHATAVHTVAPLTNARILVQWNCKLISSIAVEDLGTTVVMLSARFRHFSALETYRSVVCSAVEEQKQYLRRLRVSLGYEAGSSFSLPS